MKCPRCGRPTIVLPHLLTGRPIELDATPAERGAFVLSHGRKAIPIDPKLAAPGEHTFNLHAGTCQQVTPSKGKT